MGHPVSRWVQRNCTPNFKSPWMAIPDSQPYILNIYMNNNVEDIVVFLGLTSFFSMISFMFSCSIRTWLEKAIKGTCIVLRILVFCLEVHIKIPVLGVVAVPRDEEEELDGEVVIDAASPKENYELIRKLFNAQTPYCRLSRSCTAVYIIHLVSILCTDCLYHTPAVNIMYRLPISYTCCQYYVPAANIIHLLSILCTGCLY